LALAGMGSVMGGLSPDNHNNHHLGGEMKEMDDIMSTLWDDRDVSAGLDLY